MCLVRKFIYVFDFELKLCLLLVSTCNCAWQLMLSRHLALTHMENKCKRRSKNGDNIEPKGMENCWHAKRLTSNILLLFFWAIDPIINYNLRYKYGKLKLLFCANKTEKKAHMLRAIVLIHQQNRLCNDRWSALSWICQFNERAERFSFTQPEICFSLVQFYRKFVRR